MTQNLKHMTQNLTDILFYFKVVGPSDGSDYVIDYYGAGVEMISRNNETYMIPP